MSNCPICSSTMSESCQLCERDAEVEALKARIEELDGILRELLAITSSNKSWVQYYPDITDVVDRAAKALEE